MKIILSISLFVNLVVLAFLGSARGSFVPLDLAVVFSKVSYINSCIKNNKSHEAGSSWRTFCSKQGDAYISSLDSILK